MIRQNRLRAALIAAVLSLARSTNPVDVKETKEAEVQAGPDGTLAPLRPTRRGDWEENARLPEHLLPLHYELYLHPDLQEGTFKGRVRIDILATQPADYFLVHSKGLDIQE